MNQYYTKMPFWRKIIFLIIIILTVYSIVIIVVAPVRKLNEFKNLVVTDSIYLQQNKSILKNSELIQLSKKKAFIEAQIAMVANDSINLVVNLNDSSICLMLKGVEIKKSKIITIIKDKFFDALYPLSYTKVFSKPLVINSEYSSIEKEPIVIKKAPKNEDEAIAMATVPVMPEQKPMYFSMQLLYGINLILIQDEFVSKDENQVERKFKRDIRIRRIKDLVNGILHVKTTYYTPTIILELNAEEISSIYRAVPFKANVVITY